MAKRGKSNAGAESPNPRVVLRWLVRILPAAVLLFCIVAILQKTEDYLIENRRFRLGAAEEYGASSPDIRVEGAVNTSEEQVLRVFSEDTGRSLYLFPASERRRRLLAINWVKDAAVSRIWPNRVEVLIEERAPVAFAELRRRRGRSRVALIDEDGVLLEQPPRSEYDLPVLVGIEEKQSEPMRAVRVRRAMAMMRDLGPLAEKISEIDVSDPNNLVVTQSVEGKGVSVMLGRERFRSRLENFLSHFAEIARRVPTATTFDLRIDDRITALDGTNDGG